uniref:Uncharacterized protein n=1 Tax=Vespula pensylvanica TaxID=30213 RepID=A0A834P5M9_VESPE|nr:hypothetical protein H0235_007460 [Vespula pensylvanica]
MKINLRLPYKQPTLLITKLTNWDGFRDMIESTLTCNIRFKTTKDINTALENFTILLQTTSIKERRLAIKLWKRNKNRHDKENLVENYQEPQNTTPKISIPSWNDRNGERISNPTKILKVAHYIQLGIYTNSRNGGY